MNPASKPRSGGREAPPAAREADAKVKKIPNTDMQPDDAGTSDSGNEERGTAAQEPLKKTSQTDGEAGARKR